MRKATLSVGAALLVITLGLTFEFIYRMHLVEHRFESLQVSVDSVDRRSSELASSANRFMNESTQRQKNLRQSVNILEAAAQKRR